jgi:hypothetical protein
MGELFRGIARRVSGARSDVLQMLGRSGRPVFLLVLVAVSLGSLTASASAGRKPWGDISPPTVVLNQSQGQTDPTLNALISFTATFSEAVTGFSGSDVAIGGSSGGAKTVAVSSRDGKTFTVNVTGMSGTAGRRDGGSNRDRPRQ